MNEDILLIITILSLIVIGSVFLICLIYIHRQKKAGTLYGKRRWIEQLPSVVSTLGVLGTFLGITVGLLYFDTNDLDNSIPDLLGGLKTAFFTSLAGMLCSLVLSRQVNSAMDEVAEKESDIEVAAGKICRAVEEMNRTTQSAIIEMQRQNGVRAEEQSAFYQTFGQTMADIAKNTEGLSGYAGETLELMSGMAGAQNEISDEIRKFSTLLRSEVDEIETKMTETNELLVHKFDEFSVLLKKSNTEALVEVMKNVTQEFQKQMDGLISRLVHENFEQLNQSVGKLNTWQQENKVMIASLTEQYRQMTLNFEQTSSTLTDVSNDTRRLVSEGGKLKQLIDTLDQVFIQDQRFVQTATHMEQSASLNKEVMLQFEESTKSLNEWVRKQRDFVDGVQLLIRKLDELNKLRDYNEQFWQTTKHSLEEGVGFITQGSKTLNSQLTALDKQFYDRLSTTLAELDSCIQAMIKRN